MGEGYGSVSTNRSMGGGGAGTPALSLTLGVGGVGIEWPWGSNVYYGSGGSAANALDISSMAPGNIGKGAGGNVAVDGNDGIVQVRYVVPGVYTDPMPLPTKNIIAFGGIVTATATYKQHFFTSSGVFQILSLPQNFDFYLDVIIIGGGGGGSSYVSAQAGNETGGET